MYIQKKKIKKLYFLGEIILGYCQLTERWHFSFNKYDELLQEQRLSL